MYTTLKCQAIDYHLTGKIIIVKIVYIYVVLELIICNIKGGCLFLEGHNTAQHSTTQHNPHFFLVMRAKLDRGLVVTCGTVTAVPMGSHQGTIPFNEGTPPLNHKS